MKKSSQILLLSASGLFGLLFSLYQHSFFAKSSTVVAKLETVHSPISFVSQIKGDPKAGQKIFNEFCAVCHAKQPVIDIKAPRLGGAEWRNLKKLGEKQLLAITISGTKAMPARGGCFECSDEQLREALRFILNSPLSPEGRKGRGEGGERDAVVE